MPVFTPWKKCVHNDCRVVVGDTVVVFQQTISWSCPPKWWHNNATSPVDQGRPDSGEDYGTNHILLWTTCVEPIVIDCSIFCYIRILFHAGKACCKRTPNTIHGQQTESSRETNRKTQTKSTGADVRQKHLLMKRILVLHTTNCYEYCHTRRSVLHGTDSLLAV